MTAGSVVTHSVAPMSLVQGNPATQVAVAGIIFSRDVSAREFSLHMKPDSRRASVAKDDNEPGGKFTKGKN